MHGEHIFPPVETEFNNFVDTAIPYLTKNAARLGVSTDNVTLIGQLQKEWDENWLLYINKSEHTADVTTDKNELRKEIEEALHTVYGDIPQSALTTADRSALHLKVHETHGSRVPVMEHAPTITVSVTIHLQHTLRFQNSSTADSKAVPPGQTIFLEFFVGEAGLTAANIVFGSGNTITRFKTDVAFTEAQVGKTCYYHCCYLNKHGERSPWSAVESALVG